MGQGAWRRKGFLEELDTREEDRGGNPEREGRSQVGGDVELLTWPFAHVAVCPQFCFGERGCVGRHLLKSLCGYGSCLGL